MKNRPAVLVIYKKSAYQVYVRERKDRRFAKLIRSRDPSVERIREADAAHRVTLERARKVLAKLGARAEFRYRRDARSSDEFDLVVTLGGDGTLLLTSHNVGPNLPMVAINTAPLDSVGFYCAGDMNTMESTLAEALAGRLAKTRLTRMQVDVDGKTVTNRVLNDVLFCHECPAATTRYLLRVNGHEEDQKSSGIWVGPAAGSTAAQRSAGGRILPPSSKRLQFVVREPYQIQGQQYQLTKGLIRENHELVLRSKITRARLYIDGPHVAYPIPIGAKIRMTQSAEPLTLLGFPRSRRT